MTERRAERALRAENDRLLAELASNRLRARGERARKSVLGYVLRLREELAAATAHLDRAHEELTAANALLERAHEAVDYGTTLQQDIRAHLAAPHAPPEAVRVYGGDGLPDVTLEPTPAPLEGGGK